MYGKPSIAICIMTDRLISQSPMSFTLSKLPSLDTRSHRSIIRNKNPQRRVLKSTISGILRMDVPLIGKTFVSVFTGKLRLATSYRNIKSHRVCKNQEIVRFLENVQDGI